MVDVAPLREAFQRSGLSACEVARRMGWIRTRRFDGRRLPDQSRVVRYLGLREYQPGHGYENRFRARMREDVAERFARALDVDPFEVGL
jgi:hypothetical protein